MLSAAADLQIGAGTDTVFCCGDNLRLCICVEVCLVVVHTCVGFEQGLNLADSAAPEAGVLCIVMLMCFHEVQVLILACTAWFSKEAKRVPLF